MVLSRICSAPRTTKQLEVKILATGTGEAVGDEVNKTMSNEEVLQMGLFVVLLTLSLHDLKENILPSLAFPQNSSFNFY